MPPRYKRSRPASSVAAKQRPIARSSTAPPPPVPPPSTPGARDDSSKDEEAQDAGGANMEEGNPPPFGPSFGAGTSALVHPFKERRACPTTKSLHG
ncbi:hypothetical protein JCGZ_01834 [Jatropha curcas]|uniref:Uncharacterized protein n=1 Tax=Jatropha curcas TaxID=180498 RepID=A0A067L2F6_JATCU|nr:hypothetical protein JCGZ_01834 [Jatropha curcas]